MLSGFLLVLRCAIESAKETTLMFMLDKYEVDKK